MLNKKKLVFTLVGLCVGMLSVMAQVSLLNPQTDMKLLKKWQDTKLGLFVHWMACHTPETGDSWAIGNGTSKHIADSISLAWNPEKFSAKEIVDFAKKAGCGYMVVIAKHHDGFGIWNSKYSDWDVKRSRFKKDILKELGDECRKHGLLFGIYYSIADLNYTGWERMPPAYSDPVEPKSGKKDFVDFCHNQVKELIDRYNPAILWFDGFWLDPLWGAKEGLDLYNFIKAIKPDILVTRLAITKDASGKETFINDGSSGDFFSYEAKTNDAPNFPWEACTSVSYPVYAYEPEAKLHTKAELITTFDKVICGNGNFLLNIGPKSTGELPEELTARFLDLTSWIIPNKSAVYKTCGGPFKQGDWGGSTYRGDRLFIHLRKKVNVLKFNTLGGYKVKSASILSTGNKVAFETNGQEVSLHFPDFQEGTEIPVIALKLNRDLIFTEWLPLIK